MSPHYKGGGIHNQNPLCLGEENPHEEMQKVTNFVIYCSQKPPICPLISFSTSQASKA